MSASSLARPEDAERTAEGTQRLTLRQCEVGRNPLPDGGLVGAAAPTTVR